MTRTSPSRSSSTFAARVTTSSTSPSEYRRATGAALWGLAAMEGRVIVTHDRDFPVLGQSTLPAALILMRPQNNRPAAILDLFRTFWEQINESEVLGHVFSVQPARHRRRPLR